MGESCTELLPPLLSQVGARRKDEAVELWSCAASQRTHTVGQKAARVRAGCCNDHRASRVTHVSGAMNNTLTLTHGRLWSHGLACKWICWCRQIVLFSLRSIFPSGNTYHRLGVKIWLIRSHLQNQRSNHVLTELLYHATTQVNPISLVFSMNLISNSLSF